MKHELRKLKSSDIGQVCKIIKAIGIKEFKSCFKVDDFHDGKIEKIGLDVFIDILDIVMNNITSAQKEIDVFIASLIDVSLEDVQNMDLDEYTDIITEIVQKDEFRDFFGRVGKLLNQ